MQKRTVWKLALVCISILLCGVAAFWQPAAGGVQVLQGSSQPLAAPKTALVQVCVTGAVAKPGVYEVPKGVRASEAIAKAGGLTEAADKDRVNLARICKDGTHIRVPELTVSQRKKRAEAKAKLVGAAVQLPASAAEEAEGNATGGMKAGAGQAAGCLVHLNTADKAQLCTLPGVGEATAEKIIAYRQKKPFATIQEVMEVKGIGKAKFARMQSRLAL